MRPPAARAYTPTALFGLDARCVWARYSSSFSLVAYPEQARIAGSASGRVGVVAVACRRSAPRLPVGVLVVVPLAVGVTGRGVTIG
ncbi:MAG: hypothetical protein ACK55Z_25265, partial [bacterium]